MLQRFGMGNQTQHAELLCHGVGLRDVNLVHWLCIKGGGALKKHFLGFAWCACWIIIPYGSVSGKTLLKFRFDVFSSGSQSLNISVRVEISDLGSSLKK